MEVFVSASKFGFANWVFPENSVVREVLVRFVQKQGFGSSSDFYVVQNGRLSAPEEPLQPGAVYHLQPRLCGGKGGFGSMLRALGAQIEKTTNREACRDLSGRRLRDVNHEKEMAEWLQQQAQREAEKEQQRAERLQRRLREPEHRFSDATFQQQCHQLAERLEDSVIKGLQATSSGQVRAGHAPASKRHRRSKEPHAKRRKMAATCWTGLEELQSSEEDEEEEEDEAGSQDSALSPSSAEVLVPEQINRDQQEAPGPSDQQEDPGPSGQQEAPGPSGQEEAPGPSGQQEDPGPSGQEEAPGPSGQQEAPGPSGQQEDPGPSGQQEAPGPSGQQEAPGPSGAQESRASGDCEASEQVQPAVDLTTVTSVDQLEVLGLDVLKEELRRRGLKCGGTLAERAGRLFSIRGLPADQVDPALLAKPTKGRRKR